MTSHAIRSPPATTESIAPAGGFVSIPYVAIAALPPTSTARSSPGSRKLPNGIPASHSSGRGSRPVAIEIPPPIAVSATNPPRRTGAYCKSVGTSFSPTGVRHDRE